MAHFRMVSSYMLNVFYVLLQSKNLTAQAEMKKMCMLSRVFTGKIVRMNMLLRFQIRFGASCTRTSFLQLLTCFQCFPQ